MDSTHITGQAWLTLQGRLNSPHRVGSTHLTGWAQLTSQGGLISPHRVASTHITDVYPALVQLTSLTSTQGEFNSHHRRVQRYKGRQTDRQTGWETDRQIDRQTYEQMDKKKTIKQRKQERRERCKVNQTGTDTNISNRICATIVQMSKCPMVKFLVKPSCIFSAHEGKCVLKLSDCNRAFYCCMSHGVKLLIVRVNFIRFL